LLPALFGEETAPSLPPGLQKLRITQVTLGYLPDTDARTNLPNITVFTPGANLSTLQNLSSYNFTQVVSGPFAFSWATHGAAFEKLQSVELYHQLDPQNPAIRFNSAVPSIITGTTDFAGYRLNVKVEVSSSLSEAMTTIPEGSRTYLYFSLHYNLQPVKVNSLAFLNNQGVPVLFVFTPVTQLIDNGDSVYLSAYITFDPTMILNPETANIDLLTL